MDILKTWAARGREGANESEETEREYAKRMYIVVKRIYRLIDI